MFRTRPGLQPQWRPVAFQLSVQYPTTDGDNSKWTWLAHAGDPFICHSVYTQVLRYGLQVPTKRKNRPDIPARGIAIEREEAMTDVRKLRKEATEAKEEEHRLALKQQLHQQRHMLHTEKQQKVNCTPCPPLH